jgi:hypothetical protein
VIARRPRRAGLLVLLILSGVMLSGVMVAGCSAGSDRSAPRLAEVRALLARHGAAVLNHDAAAFMSDVDTASDAADFRVRQRQVFANLMKLPLASWSYRLEAETDAKGAEAAASRRFGTGAIIVRLSLNYAFRGVDRIPTRHDLWWTFVRDDGRVVVAADDSLAQAGGQSWQGPWDFGPLVVRRGAHSLVIGHPDSARALDGIRARVDAAVPAVTSVWGRNWSQDVAVIVPSSDDELRAQAGQSTDATLSVAAVAISDGADPVSGAVYGQRLIVNPAALRQLSRVGQQIVVRHEITHIAAAPATSAASPTWLIEGFADYVGNLHSGQSVTTTAAELTADVRRGRVPGTLPTTDAFSTQGQSAQAYEGAWLACRLIAQRAGQAGLVRFYRVVGASPLGSSAAVAGGLRRVLHETTARFTAQWRDYLIAQLGG